MSRSCIIFSCTILSKDRLFVLEEFLQEFENNFKDCDIYVGINPPSIADIEERLARTSLRIKGVKRAPQHLYTESDASGFQTALQLANASGMSYENCWFVHTKGGVNEHSNYLRKWYIVELLGNRKYVEGVLCSSNYIGSYGMLGLEFDKNKHYNETDTDIPIFTNKLTEALPYTHANFFYIHTLFVVKYEIVSKFLSLISEQWFITKLDRYYFEGIFPFIVSRLGYFPYIDNNRTMNGLSIDTLNREWIVENNLHKLTDCLGKSAKDYYFNQLTPPYVTSNTQS